jgi:hypothetical protein
VHFGGRRESLIGLFTLLLFHPSDAFSLTQQSFVRFGGRLSQNLCALAARRSDCLCLLCSLAMINDDAKPSVWGREAPVVRLDLAKVLYNNVMDLSPTQIAAAYRTTNSPIARVLMGRFAVVPPELEEKCPPIRSCAVIRLHTSKECCGRIAEIVAEEYLFLKSYLFEGTELQGAEPAFLEIDGIVIENSV